MWKCRPLYAMCGHADVGIHPETDRGDLAHLRGDLLDHQQFRGRLHIEPANAQFQGIRDLVIALAHAGVDDGGGGEPGLVRHPDLAAAHAVCAEAGRGDPAEDLRVGIGLDRVVDLPQGTVSDRAADRIQRPLQQGQVVEVERRLPSRELPYREIALHHFANRLALRALRASSLSSSLIRKEML